MSASWEGVLVLVGPPRRQGPVGSALGLTPVRLSPGDSVSAPSLRVSLMETSKCLILVRLFWLKKIKPGAKRQLCLPRRGI